MISFIMMAKNVDKYLSDAINELQKEKNIKWELIVVDDHSSDSTFEVATSFAKDDSRIKVAKNPYAGKVKGTNYGYSLSSGEIVKCIDSDDVLLMDFFKHYEELKKHDAHCHPSYITDENLNRLAIYQINPLMLSVDYSFVLSNLISFPKVSWSFKRSLADKIFPLPDDLPFEDVWISLLIKKNADSIYNIKQPLYLYRQHSDQTFGGIINYSKGKVVFRAKRLLKLMDVLENEPRVMEGYEKFIFDDARVYNGLLAIEKLRLKNIVCSGLSIKQKLKIGLIGFSPPLAKLATILKWKIDAIKRRG